MDYKSLESLFNKENLSELLKCELACVQFKNKEYSRLYGNPSQFFYLIDKEIKVSYNKENIDSYFYKKSPHKISFLYNDFVNIKGKFFLDFKSVKKCFDEFCDKEDILKVTEEQITNVSFLEELQNSNKQYQNDYYNNFIKLIKYCHELKEKLSSNSQYEKIMQQWRNEICDLENDYLRSYNINCYDFRLVNTIINKDITWSEKLLDQNKKYMNKFSDISYIFDFINSRSIDYYHEIIFAMRTIIGIDDLIRYNLDSVLYVRNIFEELYCF